MALYEPSGNVHSAVYWSAAAGDISTTSDFTVNPCSPTAYTGVQLKTAKQIFQTTPALIQYMGDPAACNTGNTFSRLPDGGTFQTNRPPTIGPLRTDRCNDGSCIACGNLVLSSSPDTCGGHNGSISAQIMNQITSPPPYIYNVTGPVNIGPITTSTNPYIFNNLPAGTYIVSVSDNFVPPNYTVDTIVVGSTGSLTITSITSTPASCNASDGTATVNASGGNGTYNYSWSTTPVQHTQIATNLPLGIYSVTITSGGCSASDNVVVTGQNGPTVVSSFTPEHCGVSDGTASVLASGGSGTYSYVWNTTPPANSATITGLQAGSYTVTVSDGGSCSPVVTIIVNDIPGPTAGLSVTPIFAQPGQNIVLQSLNNTNVVGWHWNFGDGNQTQTIVPALNYNYSTPGDYTIWLLVTDNNGCKDSISVKITIVEFKVPNIITPNGDGTNEFFYIKGLEAIPDKKLTIFNRWGKPVFKSSDYQNDWNGGKCADGVYYYVLIVPGIDKEINGTITILR